MRSKVKLFNKVAYARNYKSIIMISYSYSGKASLLRFQIFRSNKIVSQQDNQLY